MQDGQLTQAEDETGERKEIFGFQEEEDNYQAQKDQ